MILAIDPGTMTGVAATNMFGQFEAWQAPPEEVGSYMLKHFVHGAVDAIVMERFLITSSTVKKSRAGMYDALYLIGLSHHLCKMYDVPFIGQTPAEGKRITREQLEAERMWPKGLEHAQDASRHLYLHLAKLGKL